MSKQSSSQPQLPIQPVNEPILNGPYEEPAAHWVYDTSTGDAHVVEGRRPASYWYKTERVKTSQMALPGFAEEEREDLPLVNNLRADVKRWREAGYEGATQVTKQLLTYWWRPDRPRRLFYCQLEAVETIIFLNEIRLAGKFLRFNPLANDVDLRKSLTHHPSEPLTRLGVKMATGSGKTVVMSMLIAWAFCNRGQVSSDERFPDAVLVVCPNLTIKERLQVLRPDHPQNYYAAFDLVPAHMRPLLQSGKVLLTNWHLFLPESPHAEGGKTYDVVNKGPEGPEAFARRVLDDLYSRAERGGLMVFNDEAHHAWRPAPILVESGLVGETAVDLEEATIWVQGLDMLNSAVGVRFCVDLSATPFYLPGSGYVEGSPFPWLVSDFGLVDAIESGIVKIPRMPVSDTTGRPEPKYFRLWEEISRTLDPGEKLSNGKPKPDVVYRKAEGALRTLAGQWQERYTYIQEATNEQDKTPPVMIIVCDNTDLAELFYQQISGEREEEVAVVDGKDRTKIEKLTVYGGSQILPAFSNHENFRPTIRIDSKMLDKAESGDPSLSRQDAAEQLRQIVATVGKPGEPGEQVRCVVSVAMLNEGWDANNVTHILGLRAFGSQLLCEQVVGRGLRRMDYTPDPETGRLTEEYVDIYGVPFSLIPFKGRKGTAPQPVDKPKNHVRAMPERAAFEIKFPVVEGYAFSLKRNLITADIDQIEPLRLEPELEPSAIFVRPRVGYEVGRPSRQGPGEELIHDRQYFYDNYHIQTIEYDIARRIVETLISEDSRTPSLRQQSRHQLFPQVLHIVRAYVQRRVDFRGVHKSELGLQHYMQRVIGRLVDAIRPDETQGETPLLPILYRYAPTGSTADVDFKTTRICHTTSHSHINQMPMDTATWESSAAFYLELGANQGIVRCYARNDGLNFTIPYDYYGISHHYEPDFLVELLPDPASPEQKITVIVEVKGYETDQDRAKHQAARRWVKAVNNWGQMGQWHFHVTRDPHLLLRALDYIRQQLLNKAVVETAETAVVEPVAAQPVPTTLPKAWRESIQVAPECEDFLLRCHQAGIPLPEVGYETRDRRRHQAELAWETLNVALFLPGYDRDKPAFDQAGWHTFMLAEAEAALTTLREKAHA
jgi:type III restriction enzyme